MYEGVVEIAAALEFLLDEALRLGGLLREGGSEVGACLERREPDADADEQRYVCADDEHPAGHLEPEAGGGEGGAGEGDEEGEEDEGCVDDYACGVVRMVVGGSGRGGTCEGRLHEEHVGCDVELGWLLLHGGFGEEDGSY